MSNNDKERYKYLSESDRRRFDSEKKQAGIEKKKPKKSQNDPNPTMLMGLKGQDEGDVVHHGNQMGQDVKVQEGQILDPSKSQ